MSIGESLSEVSNQTFISVKRPRETSGDLSNPLSVMGESDERRVELTLLLLILLLVLLLGAVVSVLLLVLLVLLVLVYVVLGQYYDVVLVEYAFVPQLIELILHLQVLMQGKEITGLFWHLL